MTRIYTATELDNVLAAGTEVEVDCEAGFFQRCDLLTVSNDGSFEFLHNGEEYSASLNDGMTKVFA